MTDLRTRAILFVAGLQPGDLLFSWDPATVPFQHHIPAALARRHLRMEWTADQTWVVRPTIEVVGPTFDEVRR